MPRKIRAHADLTRQAILKAARQLFAQKGFSGTPTLKIAEAAQVNEALIFHHFGNKAKLWQAVKAFVLEDLDIAPLNPEPQSLDIFLEEAIQQRLQMYAHHPDLLRLMEWQRLESDKIKLVGGSAFSPLQWLEPIQHLQSHGQINSQFDPQLIILWLVGSIQPLITDEPGLLQDPCKQKIYITMLVSGFQKSLTSTPYAQPDAF